MKRRIYILVALSIIILLPVLGSQSATPAAAASGTGTDYGSNGSPTLANSGTPYTGNGAALNVYLTGIHSSNSSPWSESEKTFALDYSQGTTFSVANASTVTWSAYVQISPPLGVTNLAVAVEYPLTDWVPLSLSNPLGVAKSYPSQWSYASGMVNIPTSTIDSDGLWTITFSSMNYLFDLQLGKAPSLGTTSIFDLSDQMTFQSTTPWITGSNVEFALSDPTGNEWYSGTNTTSGATAHFLQSFQYRKTITIDHTKVTANVVNFPVLIDIYDTSLKTHAQSTGADIAFVSNNVVLDHQIELFDQSYSPTQAHLVAWVKANLSSTVNTVLTMYYGNSQVTSQQHSQDVWSSSYAAVWHLNEPAADEQTSAIFYDSTSGGYDGTQSGNAQTTGKIGYGQAFDGTNDFISISSSENFNPSGSISISGWFRLNTAFTSASPTSQVIMEKYLSDTYDMQIALVGTNYVPYSASQPPFGSLVLKVESNNVQIYKWTTLTSWSAATWYHFTIIMYATNQVNDRIYINGADNTASYAGSLVTGDLSFAGGWGIGGGSIDSYNIPSGSAYFNGRLDEFRVSTAARASGWIQTEFVNELTPSSFYSVGSESSRTNVNLSMKKTLDSTASAGLWTVSAKYNDSGSSVSYRVGYYQRSFIVRHSSTLALDSPGDAIGDGISARIAGSLLYVEVNLTDDVTTDGIGGSSVTMNWTVSGSQTVKTLNDLGGGRYGLALNTSDLVSLGRWRIDIQSSDPYYTGASIFFYLDLYHNTVLTYEDVSTTPVGYDFTAVLVYRDAFDGSPISGATLTFANGTTVNPTSQSSGRYNISVSSSGLSLGKYWFIFNATKGSSYYTAASTNVTFTLRAHYTAVSVQGNLVTPYGQDTSLAVVLVDLDTGTSVSASNVASFSLASSYGTQPDGAADYSVLLTTSSWSIGTTTVTLSVTMSSSNYRAPANYAFDVQIRPHYTSVSVTGVLVQPYGNNTQVTVVLTDLDTGALVDISNVASFSFASSYGTQPNGASDYNVTLTTTAWAVGTTVVTLSVTMSSSSYAAPSPYNFNVVIRKDSSVIYNEPSDLIFPNGDDFVIVLRVNVSELGIYYGSPINGLTQAQFVVTNGTFTYPKTITSLSNGRYNLTISGTYFTQGTFTITVTVNPSGTPYASSFVVITFNYRPARSFMSSANYPQVTTPYGIDITISLNYTDVDRSLPIAGATIVAQGITFYGQTYVGGLYQITLNVTGLSKGNHIFIINASSPNYESKSLTFTLTVRIAYTYATPTVGALSIPLGNDPVFYVVYWDTDSDVSVAYASPTTDWSGSLAPIITYESSNQRYRVEFRTSDSDALQQNTVVTFNFSKGANYQFGIFTVSVTIRTHNTDFRLVSAVQPTSYNGVVNISVYYGDLDNNVGITPIANISASVVNATGLVSFALVDDPQGAGYYILQVSAAQFNALGTQTFNVTFSWIGASVKYQTKWLVATANIVGEDSRLTLMIASEPTAYLGNMSYIFFYSDLAGYGITNTSSPYGDGNVHISVSFQGVSVDLGRIQISEIDYLNQPGNYSVSFNSTVFGEIGLFYMNVYIDWTAGVPPYYTNRYDVISVRVLARDTLLSIAPPSPTSYGENATFSFTYDDVTGGNNNPIGSSPSLAISLSLSDFSMSYEAATKIFTISFNTSQFGSPLGQKSFTISIVWTGAPFYSNRTGRTVFITVIARQTVLDYQSPAPTQYLDNVSFNVAWTDVTGSATKNITGATLALYDGSNPVDSGEYSWWDNGDGTYTVELNTTYEASPGTYNLQVRLTHPAFYYLDISATRQFNIRYRVVLLTADPIGTVPYNSTLDFTLNYQDLYTLQAIGNDTSQVVFELVNGSSWYFSVAWSGALKEYTLQVETYNHPELVINKKYVLLIRMSYKLTSPFYGSDDAYISFQLRARASQLELQQAPDSAAYLEFATFMVFYRDTDSSQGVIASSIQVYKGATPLTLGTQYTVTNNGGGSYTVAVNTTALGGLGLTQVTVYANWNPSTPPYHASASLSLSLRVVKRDASIQVISPPSLTRFNDNVSFTFSYMDLLKAVPITTITVSDVYVYADGTLLVQGQYTLSETAGVYTLEVNSSILSSNLVSNYNLTIHVDWNDLQAPFYTDDSTLVRVTTTNRQMAYSPNPVTDTDFGLNLTISFLLTDSGNGDPIIGATIAFNAQSVSLTENVDFWITEGSGATAGVYVIRVNSTSLGSPGTYYFGLNITWDVGSPYYTNLIGITQTGLIRGTPTNLIITNDLTSAFWKSDAPLSVEFNNSLSGALIPGAMVNWTWPGVGSGGFTDVGDGSYLASINTSLTVHTGTYIITITASKDKYKTSIGFISLVVRPLLASIQTVDPSEPIIFISRGSGLNVTAYLKNEVGAPLQGSYVTSVTATLEGSPIILLFNGTAGFYSGVFPANGPTIMDPGFTANVRISAILINYDPATTSFQVSITTAKTTLELAGGTQEDVSVTYSRLVNITVQLSAPDFSINISNAHVVWVLSERGLNGNFTPLGHDGLFFVTFNTTDVGYGIWGLSIRATPDDPLYSSSSTQLSLTIKRIGTEVLQPPNLSVTWGWSGNMSFVFKGDYGNVSGATASYSWATFRGNATDVGDGLYVIFINTSLVDPGSYTLSILFQKVNYQEDPASVRIEVLPVPTELVVSSVEYSPTHSGNMTNPTDLSLPIGDSVTITLLYNDTDSEDGYVGGLDFATLTDNSRLWGPSGNLDFALISLPGGLYQIVLNTKDPNVNASAGSEYKFVIELELANRTRSQITVLIRVIDIPTRITVLNDRSSWTIVSGALENGDSPMMELFYNDTWHNRGISGAALLLESTNTAVDLTYREGNAPGTYYVYLNTGGLLQQGSGFVKVTISAPDCVSHFIERSVTVQYNDFDRLVINATFYGLPIALIIIAALIGYVRVYSVPKRVRQMNGQIKALGKGKIPKPIEGVKSRQELIADLYNDSNKGLIPPRTADVMPEESVLVNIPEMGELLIQLSILTHLNPDELDEFKADIAKMKLSEQAAFVKEVIDQEAIRAARRDGKTFEQVIAETGAEAKRMLSGGESELKPSMYEEEPEEAQPPEVSRVIMPTERKEPAVRPSADFEPAPSGVEDKLSQYELDELRSNLIRRGVPESEITTIMEQASTLSRDLVEELLRSLDLD
jgi:hypothetical protein